MSGECDKCGEHCNEICENVLDLGKEGDLILIIACTKCGATFEVNKQMLAIASITKSSFIKMFIYVLNSKCKVCNQDEAGFRSNL